MNTPTGQIGSFTPSVEQRSSPRKPFTASLDVHILTDVACPAVARDLSASGIGAIVFADAKNYAALEVGDSVVINYAHPGVKGSELVARFAWVTGRYGNRYGFRFEQPMTVA